MRIDLTFEISMEQAIKLFTLIGGKYEKISEDIGKPEVDPVRKRKSWTQFELDSLVQWYPNYTCPQIAKKLQRTKGAVGQMVYTMLQKGILKPKTNRPKKYDKRNNQN